MRHRTTCAFRAQVAGNGNCAVDVTALRVANGTPTAPAFPATVFAGGESLIPP